MLRLALLVTLALTVLTPAAEAAGPNLLRNASFEQPSLRSWSVFGPGQGATGATPGLAREGRGYGIVTATTASDTLAQDVSVTTVANHSYGFSVWVRSASGRPLSGTIALLGLTRSERASTDFTAGAEWQLVSATLSPARQNTSLRAQVELRTPGEPLLLDGAQLLDVRLRNASLDGAAGWSTENAALQVTPGTGRDGAGAGLVTAVERGGSLVQEQPFTFAAGDHHTFSAWVRSASGQPISGRLWLLANPEGESASSAFTAGANWQLVTVTLRPTGATNTTLRASVQLLTPGMGLYVDGTQLTQAGLANASFEQQFFRGWDVFPRGPLTAASAQAGLARDNEQLGVVRADVAGRSFAQDVAIGTDAGGSQTFSLWLRSPDSAGAAGSLVLSGNGGESASTAFNVGSVWTLVSVPLDAEQAHTGLRAEVVLDTPGRDLQVDGASLAAGNARDDALLGPPATVVDVFPETRPQTPAPVVVTPTPAPPVVAPAYVRSAVSYKWNVTRRSTTVTRLIVRDVPEGGWVELRCSGKGKGCPTTKPVVRRRIATTSFKTLFGKRRLKPGAQIEVRVLATGMVGKVARFQIRAGHLPKATFSCLPPGAKRPAKC